MADPYLTAYRDTYRRIAGLAADAGPALDVPLPACPDWAARQLVAHLTGVAQDLAAGRLDGYGTEMWSAEQVSRLGAEPIDEVLRQWEAAMVDLAALTDSPLGGSASMWAFGDAVVHEGDLRPILAPGTRVPTEHVALGLKAAIGRWRHHLGEAGAPTLRLQATDLRDWWLGPHDDAEATTAATLGYDLFRALFGRRSRLQVEAWDWSGDPSPFLDLGLPFPFRWADGPLED